MAKSEDSTGNFSTAIKVTYELNKTKLIWILPFGLGNLMTFSPTVIKLQQRQESWLNFEPSPHKKRFSCQYYGTEMQFFNVVLKKIGGNTNNIVSLQESNFESESTVTLIKMDNYLLQKCQWNGKAILPGVNSCSLRLKKLLGKSLFSSWASLELVSVVVLC